MPDPAVVKRLVEDLARQVCQDNVTACLVAAAHPEGAVVSFHAADGQVTAERRTASPNRSPTARQALATILDCLASEERLGPEMVAVVTARLLEELGTPWARALARRLGAADRSADP